MARWDQPDRMHSDQAFQPAQQRSDGAAALERAQHVLQPFGADITAATNPQSASNDVWLVDQFCLRMSRQPGPDTLLEEAQLAALLPADVGYPAVIATGVEMGYQWMLSQRLPGLNLWEAWPVLTDAERRNAIADLWYRHLALQGTSVHLLPALAARQPSHYLLQHEQAAQQLRRLVTAGVIENGVAGPLWSLVEGGLNAAGQVPWRLVHGDPAFGNVQCHQGRVIGLLDLEAAAIAPYDLDLDLLLQFLSNPLDDPSPAGPYGLPDVTAFAGTVEQLVRVATPHLEPTKASTRLKGYAALSTMMVLDRALGRGVPTQVLREWTQGLSTLVGGGSYLDRLWP